MRKEKTYQVYTNSLTKYGLAPKIFLSLKTIKIIRMLQSCIMAQRGKIYVEEEDVKSTSVSVFI